MTQQVNIYEAKTNLSKLIDQVLAGEQVTIARAGRPVVDIVVHEHRGIVFGGLKGKIHYDQDEFDAADAEIAAQFDFNKGIDDPS